MSKFFMKILKIALIIVAIGISLLLCRLLITTALYGYYDFSNTVHWREKTTPLDSAVVNDLCIAFSLPETDPKCKPGSVVYAPDFFKVVKSSFQPNNAPWATYNEVQKKIGKYQYDYDPPTTTGNGLTYFRAWYDFKGDKVYPVVMFFYSDGRLFRIIADVGN